MLDEPLTPDNYLDPDTLPRPIVTVGVVLADLGGIELDTHAHRKGQLMFVQRGALSCEVEGQLWIVPPGSAMWIPGGIRHSVKAADGLEGYNAFVDPDVAADLPADCRAIFVAPLLGELLIRSARLPALYRQGARRRACFTS